MSKAKKKTFKKAWKLYNEEKLPYKVYELMKICRGNAVRQQKQNILLVYWSFEINDVGTARDTRDSGLGDQKLIDREGEIISS